MDPHALSGDSLMEKLQRFALQHPLSFSILAILLFFAAAAAFAGLALLLLGGTLSDDRIQLAGQAGATLLLVLTIWRLGWLRATGVARLGNRRVWVLTALALLWLLPLTLYAFFGTVRYALPDSPDLAATAATTFAAGVVEELLFRGLLLYVLATAWGPSRRGRVAAILVTSVLWGSLHLVNATGGRIEETWLQVLNATLSGIWYGALVLEAGTIWPVVLIHGLVNTVTATHALGVPGYASHVVAGYRLATLFELPWLLYGLYLLRRPAAPATPRAVAAVPSRLPRA
jgi:membrane protease YdiL (CAAX protease family)